MTKSKAGRPGKIQSEFPLERISTRISVEAIAIIDKQDNKALFIDEAIKKTVCIHEFAPCDVAGQFIIQGGGLPTTYAKCTRCGYRP